MIEKHLAEPGLLARDFSLLDQGRRDRKAEDLDRYGGQSFDVIRHGFLTEEVCVRPTVDF
jgi:hypothetical protein